VVVSRAFDAEGPKMSPFASAVLGLVLALIGFALLLLGIWAWNGSRGWALLLFWAVLLVSSALTGFVLERLRPNVVWLLAIALPLGIAASLWALPYAWSGISFAVVYYVTFALVFGGDATDWANSLPLGVGRRKGRHPSN